ncbi:MAG: RsmD family RNA methyltransferase [Nitrososphaerota archaeon]
MKIIAYKYLEKPLITCYTAKELLDFFEEKKREALISLDLGLSKTLVYLNEKGVIIKNNFIEWNLINKILRRERDIYIVENNNLFPVNIYDKHFYKLVLVKKDTAPTLEIDGIHMHRIKDVTPLEDVRQKIDALNISKCSLVLDTCMGLGYTAIECLKRGACKIVCVEIDPNVINLAMINPWSKMLENDKIEIILGDVYKIIQEFDEQFDYIIHDPPRFSLAGNLYSLEFYEFAFDALKPNGKMFHYVGYPGMKYRGKKIIKGVKERLRKAGFECFEISKIASIIAKKPK